MKKVLMCSIASLVILMTSGMAVTKERAKNKEANKQTKKAAANQKLSAEEKQWREQLKEMTPEQRRAALAKKALQEELAAWQQVRKIALEEEATKTVAAIDKIIAAKQDQFKKKLDAAKEKESPKTKESRVNRKGAEGQKQPRKKRNESKG